MTNQAIPIKDCLVIGAGLCGLSAAFTLSQQGKRILLLERSHQVGGVIQSTWHDTPLGRVLVESGPNTFPNRSQAIMALCDQLGLIPTPTAAAATKRYLWVKGQLTAVPNHPLALIMSPILSLSAKLGLLKDLWQPVCSSPTQEISLADFCRHRLGQEVLTEVITPVISGIYAGNPEQLSLQSVFPKLALWEQQHGSLLRGAIQQARQAKRQARKQPKYQLLGFENGMATLPQALAQHLPPDSLQLNTLITGIEKTDAGYAVSSTDQRWETRTLILATPADVSATLLRPLVPQAADLLQDIEYAPMAIVHLGFPRQAIAYALDGFGFLASRTQGLLTLGCIWSSSLFPDRAPAEMALLTCFIGGAFHPDLPQQPDDALARLAIADLQTVFAQPNLSPVFTEVIRWPRAIPQCHVGHQARLQQIDAILARHCPRLSLTGNYKTGVALNDCVDGAQKTAHNLFSQSPL